MTRKMTWIGFSFLMGTALSSFLPTALNVVLIVGLIIVAISAIFLLKGTARAKNIVVLLSIAFGALIITLYQTLVYEKVLEYDGKTVTITGVVTDISEKQNDKMTVTIKGKINSKIPILVNFYIDATNCDYYDHITIVGKVEKLEDTLNFQSEQWGKSRGIYLSGKSCESVEITARRSFSLRRTALHARDYVFKRITETLTGEQGGFLSAMLCGDKSAMSETSKNKLYAVGIGHITAVSGMHLVLVCSIMTYLLKKLRLNKLVAYIASVATALAFAFFAGLTPSITRATVMFILIITADVLNRRYDILSALGVCAVVLVATDPPIITSPSFVLSMCGTFAVGYASPMMSSLVKTDSAWRKPAKTAVSLLTISVCVFPPSVCFFGTASVISPLSNLLLAPLCMLALFTAIFASVFCFVPILFNPLIAIAGVLAELVLWTANLLSKIPFCSIPTGYNYIVALTLALTALVAIVALLFRKVKLTAIAVVASVLAFSVSYSAFSFAESRATKAVVFSDSNSVILLLYNRSNSVIIDIMGGSELAPAVERYMTSHGVKSLQSVVISEGALTALPVYIEQLSAEVTSVVSLTESHLSIKNIKLSEVPIAELSFADASVTVDSEKTIVSINGILLELDEESLKIGEDEFMLERSKNGEIILIELKSNNTYLKRRLTNAGRE